MLLFGALILLGVFGLFRKGGQNYQEPQAMQETAAPQADVHSHADQTDPHVHGNESHPPHETEFRMPPYFDNPKAAALAPTMDPQTVEPAARQAYGVAQQKPELLAQMPCFCYCDRFGHTSLQDCFVTDHAVHCDVCLKEALAADEMDRQGMTGSEIRTVIVSKYAPSK